MIARQLKNAIFVLWAIVYAFFSVLLWFLKREVKLKPLEFVGLLLSCSLTYSFTLSLFDTILIFVQIMVVAWVLNWLAIRLLQFVTEKVLGGL
jgi:hypothetical protein